MGAESSYPFSRSAIERYPIEDRNYGLKNSTCILLLSTKALIHTKEKVFLLKFLGADDLCLSTPSPLCVETRSSKFRVLPKRQLEFGILVKVLLCTVLDSFWRFRNSS